MLFKSVNIPLATFIQLTRKAKSTTHFNGYKNGFNIFLRQRQNHGLAMAWLNVLLAERIGPIKAQHPKYHIPIYLFSSLKKYLLYSGAIKVCVSSRNTNKTDKKLQDSWLFILLFFTSPWLYILSSVCNRSSMWISLACSLGSLPNRACKRNKVVFSW